MFLTIQKAQNKEKKRNAASNKRERISNLVNDINIQKQQRKVHNKSSINSHQTSFTNNFLYYTK